jgi:hypothetical protein
MRPEKYSRLIFVERLTVLSWLVSVFPFLFRDRGGKRDAIFYFDGSMVGVFIARLTAQLLRISVEQLQFCYEDIRDENGNLMGLRLRHNDFLQFQKKITEDSYFQKVLSDKSIGGRLPVYLKKQIAIFVYTAQLTGYRSLFLIHVAKWKCSFENSLKVKPVLFMDRRVWMREIRRYAAKQEVRVIAVSNLQLGFRHLLNQFLRPDISFFIKHTYLQILAKGWFKTLKHYVSRDHSETTSGFIGKGVNALNPGNCPRIGVEYYGHHNLDHPELHSDMFFWQKSSLSGNDILVMFKLPADPVDEEKATELSRHNMHAIALSPKASVVPSVPVFLHRPSLSKRPALETKKGEEYSIREKKWIQEQIVRYRAEFNYWIDVFGMNNIRIYLSWFKYSAEHCVIADAMENVGGITTIYQRAFEELPTPVSTIASDIVFGFSPWNADIERKCGSIIPYHVSVGYFGDHRFELLRKPAQEIRDKLKNNGAQYIIAFFDENSGTDPRWILGHEFMRRNYEFLLSKILLEPWLGVVFKPKTPRTLRKRLGPVKDILERAEETGRCFVFEGGALHGSYPPAIGALCADIVIHGHLYAATAGVEAALAGVPTLLLDREGWPVSRLYELGVGKVVFNDWESLWEACNENRVSKANNNGFGDWSSLLDRIDPFRDGRAAERIGTYLKWLLDGFKEGLSRETVMADAAERYEKRWGKDKVTAVTRMAEKRKCN